MNGAPDDITFYEPTVLTVQLVYLCTSFNTSYCLLFLYSITIDYRYIINSLLNTLIYFGFSKGM